MVGWLGCRNAKTFQKKVIITRQKQSDLLSLPCHFAEIIESMFVQPQHPPHIFVGIFGVDYCQQQCVFFKFGVFTFLTCSMNLKLFPTWSPPPWWRVHSVGWPHHAMTSDSLPYADLRTQRQSLASLHRQHNQLELFPLCLDFPSACSLFWCPHRVHCLWIPSSCVCLLQ